MRLLAAMLFLEALPRVLPLFTATTATAAAAAATADVGMTLPRNTLLSVLSLGTAAGITLLLVTLLRVWLTVTAAGVKETVAVLSTPTSQLLLLLLLLVVVAVLLLVRSCTSVP
jgi:cytochrome b561